MATVADLEVVLAWRPDDERFDLSLGFDDPMDMGDRRLIWPEPLRIDTAELERLRHSPQRYGKALALQLFGAESLRDFYRRAKSRASEQGIPIRLRLSLDPDAPPQVQAIRWETLLDLDSDSPIAVRTDVRFSRYLSGAGWDVIAPPRKHDLKALVVVADPTNLHEVDIDPPLAPINAAAELQRARAALPGMDVTTLSSRGEATLDKIASALDEGIDVLYLVCHSLFNNGTPTLYLEDDEGEFAGVTADELAQKIEARHHRPTLAVLCACQTAGAGKRGAVKTADGGSMAPLGPLLAQAGVAAVVAMQDDVTQKTAQDFLGGFFAELDKDGVVDRAMAAARATIAERPDWWVPVLFSRLKRGRTYYSVGFSKSELEVQAFLSALEGGRCTPVLGPGLAETVLGSRASLAAKWVERWLLPIADHDKRNLTTVGQFVQAGVAGYTAHDELANYFVSTLADDERFNSVDRGLFDPNDPDTLISELGKRARAEAREADKNEPHDVIASLNLRVYISTSWTGLLTEALKAAGRDPQVLYFDWNHEIGPQEEIREPTVQQPLVYHLHGRLARPESMVLTEDDYFQWLAAWVEQRQEEIPKPIYDALMRQSLMFVGYQLHDWDFRVLFQGVRNLRGHELFKKREHVGVQVDPSAPGVEPEAAQEYLNTYFHQGGVNIYWGTTMEFLDDLAKLRRNRESGRHSAS